MLFANFGDLAPLTVSSPAVLGRDLHTCQIGPCSLWEGGVRLLRDRHFLLGAGCRCLMMDYVQVASREIKWLHLLRACLATRVEFARYQFPFVGLGEGDDLAHSADQRFTKSWITWVETNGKNYTLIFDQLQNTFLVYNEKGQFLANKSIGEFIDPNCVVIDIIPSTGLLIKYDPSIGIIYLGFGLLMITTSLSYLPYTQIWLFSEANKIWIGCVTNRGKIQLEIEFENLIRYIERLNIKTY